jgi:DtxR family Mn-dependent transcriptional regulator
MRKITENMEDYLEAIAIASSGGAGGARVKDIGALLKVKNPSVSGALKTLSQNGLAIHERYGKIKLTDKGRKIAAEVQKKHSLLSRFLTELAGVPPQIADIDACKMEHVISPETYQKLKDFFGGKILKK